MTADEPVEAPTAQLVAGTLRSLARALTETLGTAALAVGQLNDLAEVIDPTTVAEPQP